MASEGMKKFNRIMALVVGGLVGIGILIYIIISLISGKPITINSILIMVLCISAAIWGFKELRK